MSAFPVSRSASSACRSVAAYGPSSYASTSRCPFPPAMPPPPSAASRRPFSTSDPSHSNNRKNIKPGTPKPSPPTPGGTKIVFRNKPNSYYPQNQFQVDVNKAKGGIERLSHKDAFAGAKFQTSAALPRDIPKKGNLQEILFAGRSNTGKSTLLNALINSTSLVKTSSKPGHTKMLNFFEIPDQMIIVDAPGYGERGRPEWGDTFQYYLTHRPPSPPSLLVLLFTLHHNLSASDNLFLSSIPPSIAVLPVFTKTDMCPLNEIADRKRALDNAIKAARDSAFVAAEERARRRELAAMSAEFDAQQSEAEERARDGLTGGWKTEMGAKKVEGPERPLVKATTWEGICVSTKRGWVLRDKTVDAVRAAIVTQLQSTLKTDAAHRAAHHAKVSARKKEILRAAAGDRRESGRLLAELGDETELAMEAFFAGLGEPTPSGSAADAMEDEMDAQEERERNAQRREPEPEEYGLAPGMASNATEENVKDPWITSAFGRTKPSSTGSKKNWARR